MNRGFLPNIAPSYLSAKMTTGENVMKSKWMMLLLCIVFLSACQNEPGERKVSTLEKRNEEISEQQDSTEEDENINLKDHEEHQITADEQTEPQIAPQYRVSDTWSIVPIAENVNEHVVLLTIDDAPDEHALDMANTLYELNAGAIFFVNGHFLETDEEKKTLKEIYNMGFLIGNHTYSHANLTELSEGEQLKEIVRVNEMVEEITGERPVFFRAPFGMNTDYSKQVVSDEHMRLMNWSYGYDWDKDYMTKESLTEVMLNTNLLHSGANLLMHDREWTASALHDIVIGLRDKGYEIVDPQVIQTAE